MSTMQFLPSLTLVRGLPGSGKSTLAESLASIRRDGASVHIETDQYFINHKGVYVYDPLKIKVAHGDCRERVYAHLRAGHHVFVSNTFCQRWEMHAYFEMAKEMGIIPTVLLCQNRFGNIHNVPKEVLEKMKANFEYDISDTFELFFGKE